MDTSSLLWLLLIAAAVFFMMRRGGCGMHFGHAGHGGRDDHDRDAGATRDPVCGMRVEPDRAAGTRTASGRTFYLCSAECLQTFDRDPDHYARKAADEHGAHGGRRRHAGC